MAARIIIEKVIYHCDECPFANKIRSYTPDSFDSEYNIHCEKLKKLTHRFVGVFDKTPVPKECPNYIEK